VKWVLIAVDEAKVFLFLKGVDDSFAVNPPMPDEPSQDFLQAPLLIVDGKYCRVAVPAEVLPDLLGGVLARKLSGFPVAVWRLVLDR